MTQVFGQTSFMVQIAACPEGIPAHAWSVAMLSPSNLYQVASLQLAELLHFLRKRTSSKAIQSHYKDMDSYVLLLCDTNSDRREKDWEGKFGGL